MAKIATPCDGKKHRAKVRAFHAKQQPYQTQELNLDEKDNHSIGESQEANCSMKTKGSIENFQKKLQLLLSRSRKKKSLCQNKET